MHTQFEKYAYVRNHGHNNMGCGHAPRDGACPHKSIPLHFQTYLFSMVGTSFFTGTINLLINLSEPFFDTTVGPRPNLARMCG